MLTRLIRNRQEFITVSYAFALLAHWGRFFFNRKYRLFLNTVHCYKLLEDYCYYEIQIHKALCEFVVEKGLLLVKRGLPPRHIKG
jgi:hypothetical protein